VDERVSGESSCSNIRPDVGLYASMSACSGQPSADIRSLAAGPGQARDANATRPTDRWTNGRHKLIALVTTDHVHAPPPDRKDSISSQSRTDGQTDGGRDGR